MRARPLLLLCVAGASGLSLLPPPPRPSHTLRLSARSELSPAALTALTTRMVCASYLSIIVAVMTLPPCISYMCVDASFKHSDGLPSVLFVATMATMAGKFLLGAPTDALGGNRVMKLAMGANVVLLLLGGIAGDARSFGATWVALSFFYASAWGACSKLVRDAFPPAEWSRLLGLVAAASSAFLFGGVLGATRSWRKTFLASAAVQSLILAVYLAGDRRADLDLVRTAPPQQGAAERVPQLLSRVAALPQFWLMFAGKVALMTVGQFISFVPLYLATGLKLPPSRAAVCAACFSTGSLASNVLGAQYYQRLGPRSQMHAVAACNALAVGLSALLSAHSRGGTLGAAAVMAVLALWGFVWAAAFYVPPGLVALELGGAQHAALVTNIFDAGGFLSAAVFSFYAMKLGRAGDWTALLASLSACSAVALVSMSAAMAISAEKLR